MSEPELLVRCRYPYLCGEEWCDCNLTPEDITIVDENVRQLGDSLIFEERHMIILVCGGRLYGELQSEEDNLFDSLNELHHSLGFTKLVHGGARRWSKERRLHVGADFLAKTWAVARGIQQVEYLADWNRYGRSAGPRRNSHMLKSEPEIALGVAFPGGNGTQDMVDKMLIAGIEVITP